MKELRIAQAKVSMLPLEQTTDSPDLLTIQDFVFEPLMRRKDGMAIPALVDAWEFGHDGCSMTLSLREGVTFHDGSPCTAEDVKHSLEVVQGARDSFGMQGAYARYLSDAAFALQTGNRLLITSLEPMGNLPDIFCEIYVRKPDTAGLPTIGIGPYRVVDYAADRSIRLSATVAREDARPDTLTVVAIPEAQDRYEALRDGQVDMATGLELLKEAPAGDDLVWNQCPSTMSVPYFLNGFVLPFSQPEARLAINLAVDVETIIQEVWHGLATPAATVVSPYHLGHPSNLSAHGYDPDRAKALFERCEMPGSLHLRTPQYMPDRSEAVSDLVKEQLARIGVAVDVEVVEDRPEYARQVGARRIGHLAIFDSTPHSTYRVLQEKITSRNPGTWWQGVTDQQADDLIEAVSQAVDPEEGLQGFAACLSWLHESPPWLYLYHPTQRYALRPGIQGVAVDHAGLVTIAQN